MFMRDWYIVKNTPGSHFLCCLMLPVGYLRDFAMRNIKSRKHKNPHQALQTVQQFASDFSATT
jgi:hypothetical protein